MTIFTEADLVPLKADRLMKVAASYMDGELPSDDYLWNKLLAEEAALEQRFRTLFGAREVYCTGTPQATLDALPQDSVLLEEPGYDYDPSFFSPEMWGLIQLRHKPIVTVREVTFVYPGPANSLYTIPLGWVRPEKKYGRINIVPGTEGQVALPANAMIISALSGGRTIPFMIRVNYQAGMPNIRSERPDIVDAILRSTVLAVVHDQYFPSSGSRSIDGLSESISLDVTKYQEGVERRLASIEQSLNGIRCLVL